MRLISQMLMGLDKRSPETASAIEPLLSTVMPTSHHRRVSGLLRLGLLVLLLAGIGVACWTWSSGWPSAATERVRCGRSWRSTGAKTCFLRLVKG